MAKPKELPVILIADDNYSDRLLAIEAFKRALLHNTIQEVEDGLELMDYLLRQGKYADLPPTAPPMIILLDLNMPRKSGMEALREIKSNPRLRSIPIIVLTSSKADQDIVMSYEFGVNSFITKPVDFADFLDAIKLLGAYWLELVFLPTVPGSPDSVATIGSDIKRLASTSPPA